MIEFKDISEAVIKADAPKVRELTEKKLAEGINPVEILNEGLLVGMAVIGKRFKALEIYVPEVLVSARAMRAGVEVLGPALKTQGSEPQGKVLVGTVKGDIHDIGKNLVTMMLEGAGFNVIDLGINITYEGFLDAVREHKPDIVGMSSLLTTTMRELKVNIDAFKEAGLRDSVKIMVGGAPVSEKYAMEAGADAYGADAMEAVEKAKEFLGKA